MKTKQVLSSVILAAVFLITACGGSSAPTKEAMMEKEAPTAEAMMDKSTPTPEAMMDKTSPTADTIMSKDTPAADAMMEAPAWYSASLTDVSTGQAFTINDFKDKVVLVETLAMWCPNCKKQQTQVKALHET
jgi:thiol-disulfide isomerase/thioredoxin